MSTATVVISSDIIESAAAAAAAAFALAAAAAAAAQGQAECAGITFGIQANQVFRHNAGI